MTWLLQYALFIIMHSIVASVTSWTPYIIEKLQLTAEKLKVKPGLLCESHIIALLSWVEVWFVRFISNRGGTQNQLLS